MTRYKGWGYDVRAIHRGFWTYDLCRYPGGPTEYAIGEVHGDERAARAAARRAIDAEICEAA